MAKKFDGRKEGSAPQGQAEQNEKKQINVELLDDGKITVNVSGVITVFEMLAVCETLYATAKTNYLRYMEAQVFGLINLLRTKKIILEGE